ncbi:MAG: hypothetical protein KF691_12510 [Phycisphaeraceae bacterium]|nr:hypothetical protein [Phycisphaeraceae bacterium]
MLTQDYSADKLVEFIDRAGNKGWIPKATISVMKSNSKRVLWSLDPLEREDVRTVDVEAAMRRFANLNPEVSPKSLRDYRSRLEKSLSLFIGYTDDPVAFQMPKARGEGKSVVTKSVTANRKSAMRPENRVTHNHVSRVLPPSPSAPSGLEYEFPLRPDLIVRVVNLPRDLKQAEAKRLAAFLHSIAEDFTP